MSPDFLIGKDDSQMLPVETGSPVRVHREVLPSLEKLRVEAASVGFKILVVSGFRGFDHQLRIWNEKAQGVRQVLGSDDKPLPKEGKSEEARKERFFAMLKWSAFPGLSRHHWGSDMDLVDAAAMPAGYQVQLTPKEVESGGLFAPFHDWIDDNLKRFGFFRPYQKDRGGVMPERWHLSYAPLSQRCHKAFSSSIFQKVISLPEIEFGDLATQHAKVLRDQYFDNIDFP